MKAPQTLPMGERLNLILNARQQCAYQTQAGFVRHMWGVVEGDDSDGLDDVREAFGLIEKPSSADAIARTRSGKVLVWNWHLEIICEELQWLAKGKTPDGEIVDELDINVPPGHLKSRLCSVMFPAWLWLHDPGLRLWCGANDGDLSKRDSRYMRTLITSSRYRALQAWIARSKGMTVEVIPVPLKADRYVVRDPSGVDVTSQHMWTLDKDQYEKVNYANTLGGERYSQSIWARVTGKRCDGQIIDDPHDVQEVLLGSPQRVAERMQEAQTIYNGALSTRVNKGGWKLRIMQRVHSADLASAHLPRSLIPGSGVRCVVLPARFDPDHPYIHAKDPRTEAGELLFPSWHDEAKDKKSRGELGGRHYDAQYGQAPRKGAGGTFQRVWFEQRYRVAPWVLMQLVQWGQLAISVDCAFKKGKKTDFVVMQVWGRLDPSGIEGRPKAAGLSPGKYLIDQVHGRMNLPETIRALKRLKLKWPAVQMVLVEDKANGPGVIDVMREQGHSGVVPFSPGQASKEARAEISALSFEAMEIWLPLDEYASWIEDYIDEHESFPGGPNDDRVDATSQMMIRWGLKSTTEKPSELGFLGAMLGIA